MRISNPLAQLPPNEYYRGVDKARSVPPLILFIVVFVILCIMFVKLGILFKGIKSMTLLFIEMAQV